MANVFSAILKSFVQGQAPIPDFPNTFVIIFPIFIYTAFPHSSDQLLQKLSSQFNHVANTQYCTQLIQRMLFKGCVYGTPDPALQLRNTNLCSVLHIAYNF